MIKDGDKLYVITNQQFPVGVQAVQGMHAAIQWQFDFPNLASEWHQNSDYLAFLSVANQEELNKLIERAQAKEIKLSIYREPDLNHQITAIALEPSIQSKKLCSSIPLALKEKSNGK